MKILIIRFSSIGDIVLTTPVVRCIKLQTQAEIHFLTKKKYQNILQNNPYISQIFGLDARISQLLPELKAQNYDLIIDLHNNLRTLWVKLFLGKKSVSFQKLNLEKWLLVNFKIDLLPKLHIVDRNLKTALGLGVVNDEQGLDFFIDAQNIVNAQAIFGKKYIAFAVGAQHATKRLPTPKIIEICDQLPMPVVLLGDKTDYETAQKIAQKSRNTHIFNACGGYNLQQSASIVQQAQRLITHDTGLMHIAAALRTPTTSVWGSTVPAFGMTPYKTPHTVVQTLGLGCRPCSKIGYSSCPKTHFKCMQNIDIQEVLASVSLP